MLGTGKLRAGTKTLYKDGNLKNPYSVKANSTPNVKILDQTSNAYFVDVDSPHFDPKKVWIGKKDVVNVKMTAKPNDKPSVKPSATLETGDTMKMFDKNGVEIGIWTFKSTRK